VLNIFNKLSTNKQKIDIKVIILKFF